MQVSVLPHPLLSNISPATIITVAGVGYRTGIPAIEADAGWPMGVVRRPDGDLIVIDYHAHRLWRIDHEGILHAFAGDGIPGNSGDGGPARDAVFHHPEHLAFDEECRHLYVCDNSNDRVRRINIATGIVETVLGNGRRSSAGDGGPAVEASTLMPDAICLDVHNNLYVGEKYGYRIRKVDAATGIVTTLVGNGVPGFGEEGLPGPQTMCNSVEAGIWADPDGSVFWGDCSGRLRRCDGQIGIVTTVLGGTSVHDSEPATSGFLNGPGGLAIGPDGTIYIADVWNQRVRAIDPETGLIRTVAGNGARAYGGDNGPATDAYLGNPHDVAIDSQGRLLIADTRNGRIRRVELDGTIITLAGTTLPWDAGEGRWDKGDGGTANSASFMQIEAVAVGPDDDVYVGDGAGRIRRIDAQTLLISTVAGVGLPGYTGDGGPATEARIGTPTAIDFDSAGNLYFTDKAYHVVRRVGSDGTISTIAGCGEAGFSPDGTRASNARINLPYGLCVDPGNTVYFSDSANNRARRITKTGQLETVAGCAYAGDSGDDGPATQARLNEPHGLCFVNGNVLLISDHYNNRVRAVCMGVEM